MWSCLPVLVLAVVGVQQGLAQRLRPNAYCVDGCSAAFGLITFEGSSELDNYLETCQWPLFVNSLVYCSMVYCNPTEVKRGLEAYNTTCKTYSSYSLKSYDNLVGGVDQKALRAVPRVADGSTEQYSHPVIPDQALFDAGLHTAAAFDGNINYSWYFGYACIGYWALVLVIGIVNRVIVVSKQHRPGNPADAVSRPLQLPQSTSSWIRKNLILPGAFGGRVQYAFGGCCTIPPRLETLLLVLFIVLNFIFCFPGHSTFIGNLYYPERRLQLARYVADRSGILAIANFPAVWLFAARNDPFLWLTGWSFASYNRFHRWVARVATVQAIVHALAYTVFAKIHHTFASSWAKQYWFMGGMSVIGMSLMLGLSIYWLRNKHYDLFLVLHIVFALLILIGLWYHIRIFRSEYKPFVWFCVGMWAFDRFLRITRIILVSIVPRVTRGVTAVATYSPATDLIRLDVTDYFPKKAAQPGIFYYLYEPTSLRGYESHPFTLCSWVRSASGETSSAGSRATSTKNGASKEMRLVSRPTRTPSNDPDEVNHTFLVRPYAGFTGRLRDKIMKSQESQTAHVTILLEGPYGDHIHLEHFTDLLVVAGGSGITAAISHSSALLQTLDCDTKIHIVWAVRHMTLVHDVLRHELSAVANNSRVRIDVYHTPEEQTKEGQMPAETPFTVHDGRPDIESVLAADRQRCDGSMVMVCCGPPAMADTCRDAVVSQLGKSGARIEFINDAMGW